jgi:hypothetical protein
LRLVSSQLAVVVAAPAIERHVQNLRLANFVEFVNKLHLLVLAFDTQSCGDKFS